MLKLITNGILNYSFLMDDFGNLKNKLNINADSENNYSEAKDLLTRFALDDFDLQSIIDKAIEQVCKILETDHCFVLHYIEEEQVLKVIKQVNFRILVDKFLVNSGTEWDVTYALKNKTSLITNDYADEKRFSKPPSEEEIVSGAQVVVKGSDRIYGIMGMYSDQPNHFNEVKANFLQVIGIVIGVSVERSLKEQNLKKSNEDLKEKIKQVKKLQRQILKSNVYERWKVGEFLHEELVQDLLATDLIIRSTVQKLQQSGEVDLTDLQKNTERVIKRTKEVYQHLVPVDIEKEGTKQAFRRLVDHIKQTYNVNCKLENSKVLNRIEDVELATQLYRLAQEIVKNAILYRNAKHISMIFNTDQEYLYLKITDDGELYSICPLKGESMGIDIIQHQAELMGGSLEIERRSDNKKGLQNILKIPLVV